MKQKISFILICLLLSSLYLYAEIGNSFSPQNSTWKNPATEWFSKAKIGAFTHFLCDKNNFNTINQFDVEGLVEQLSNAKVGYFIFTLGQNSGYYNAPNPVYDKLAGYKAGERCSKRDIPMELGKALKKKGIRFMLYLPCQTPNQDLKAIENMGFPAEPINKDREMTQQGTKNWAKVIAYWSKHYGKLVSGWWFDGGYQWCRFDADIAILYAKAAKAGNKNSIVTFNPGVSLKRATSAEDYTAGEINDPLTEKISDRWIKGSQAHILTYMGDTWGRHNLRFEDNDWITWIKGFTSKGGVVSIDMGVNYDPEKGPVGLIEKSQIEQMRHIIEMIGQ